MAGWGRDYAMSATIREQAEDMVKKCRAVLSGARALAERMEEKEKAGQLTDEEEEGWRTAIEANVKRADELNREITALAKRIG